MSITTSMLKELDQEAATTRRVLERVPQDKLTWKPHPKSMSLGYLAMHVAMSPGVIAGWAVDDVFDFGKGGKQPDPSSVAEILAAHDKSCADVKDKLGKIGDEGLKK